MGRFSGFLSPPPTSHMPLYSRGWAHLLAVLAVQQALVRGDLALQPGLDVQQHLVLVVLPLQVTANVSQLGLHVADHALHLGQLGATAGLRLRQGGLQGVPLRQKEKQNN